MALGHGTEARPAKLATQRPRSVGLYRKLLKRFLKSVGVMHRVRQAQWMRNTLRIRGKRLRDTRIRESLLNGKPQFAVSDSATIRETLSLLRPNCRIALERIGDDGDGGYFLPDNLSYVDGCFSPGVGDSSHFEAALAERGIRSFLADGSVDGPAQESDLFDFEKKYLSPEDSPTSVCLESWVTSKCPDGRNLILQMDIEGAEWAVLSSVEPSVLRRFAIIAIEFHDLHMVAGVLSGQLIRKVLQKVRDEFSVCTIHPNNNSPIVHVGSIDIPPTLEVTFVRNDLVSLLTTDSKPHVSETFDNASFMPSIRLSDFWRMQVAKDF